MFVPIHVSITPFVLTWLITKCSFYRISFVLDAVLLLMSLPNVCLQGRGLLVSILWLFTQRTYRCLLQVYFIMMAQEKMLCWEFETTEFPRHRIVENVAYKNLSASRTGISGSRNRVIIWGKVLGSRQSTTGSGRVHAGERRRGLMSSLR